MSPGGKSAVAKGRSRTQGPRVDDPQGQRAAVLARSIERARAAIASLAALGPAFDDAVGLLVDALRSGGKVLACGNGGSASDAAHFMTELLCRFRDDRPSLPGIALTTDGAFLTATANDYGYERVFARQVEGLGCPGDVLVGITTSGNSESVNAALVAAAGRGMATLGLLGRDGGAARPLCRVALVVPALETAGVQEAHIVLVHALCEAIESELFPELRVRSGSSG